MHARQALGEWGEEPAKKLLLSILKNGIIKWNRQDMYIMRKQCLLLLQTTHRSLGHELLGRAKRKERGTHDSIRRDVPGAEKQKKTYQSLGSRCGLVMLADVWNKCADPEDQCGRRKHLSCRAVAARQRPPELSPQNCGTHLVAESWDEAFACLSWT